MKADRALALAFVQSHPEQAAETLESASSAEANEFLESSDAAVAAGVLERMEPQAGGACLSSWPAASVAQVLAGLSVPRAANMLRTLDPAERKRLLELAPPDVAGPLGLALAFPENTAGAAMDPAPFALPDDIEAGEAARRIRSRSEKVRYYLYAVDRAGALVGVVNLRELLLAPSTRLVREIMHPVTERIPARASLGVTTRHPAWERFRALPVVDERGCLVGVLGVESIRRGETSPPNPRSSGPLSVGVDLLHLYWVATSALVGQLLSSSAPASTSAPASQREGG